MPNWKKVITSGSDASLNSLSVSNGITGSLLGTASYASTASFLLGSIESASYALTASYALNGGGGGGPAFPYTGSAEITGSLIVTGSINSTNGFTGSLNGTASWANNASTASYLNTLNQDLTVNGNVTLNGTASIAYLNVSYESASVIYSSGSNQFGDATNDTQTLIGRTIVSGSLEVTGSVNAPSITGSLLGTASWSSNTTSASFAATASSVNPLNQNVIITGSLAISGSATGSIFSVSASYIDFDFDSFLFSGSTVFQSALDATQAVSTFGTASINFGNITGSLFGTSSWAVSSSVAISASRAVSASRADSALSASFASTASFVNPLIQNVLITGSTLLTGSLTLTGRDILTGSFTASNSESIQLINQRLVHPATTGSRIFQTSVSTTFVNVSPNQTSTALRLNPTFTGSFSGSNTQNLIADFGATNVGSQFTVNDVTSGSIYMVNDVSGLPIIEATSNWDVNIYDYPNVIFKKTGSAIILSSSFTVVTGSGTEFAVSNTGVIIGNATSDNHPLTGSLRISGSLVMATSSSFVLPLTASASPATGSAYWSGSFLFVYDGTQYRSSSFA